MTAATAARGVMPLSGHAREARTRAARAAVALAIGMIAGFVLSDPILEVLRAPIEQIALSRNASLNFDSVTGAFDLRLRIALVAGIVVSSPVWIAEIFLFIAPGLTRRERRFAVGYSGVAAVLFVAGCLFGVEIFPRMVELLTGFASDADTTLLNASTYVDFVLRVVIATGLAFAIPVVLVLLNAVGAVSARSIQRGWRVIVVAIVLFSALVTPAADVVSMFLVAVPMALLFGAAIAVTSLHDRRLRRRMERADPERDITPSLPSRGASSCSD